MSERAQEGRQGQTQDFVWVVVYSILVLMLMLRWVYVPT
jgi:hypothetical protein